MDVRCERCKTEYELDETRIADAGLTVKCTQCGNIFKVRKPFITTPGLEVPPQKEWRVRRQDGQQLALRNLTELQRWIVERRVGPNDEVSLSGETWRKLGTLPELGAFFEVVQVAEQGRALGAPPVSRDVALSDTMVGISVEDPAANMVRSRTPAWSGQAGVAAGRGAAEPAWATGSTPSVEVDLDENLSAEELKNLRGGGAGKWLVLLLLVAGGGGGAYWLIKSQPSSPPGTLPAPKMEPPPSLQPSTPSPTESAKPAGPAEPKPEVASAATPEATAAAVAPPPPTAVPPVAAPASPPVPTATAPQPAMAKEGAEGGGIPAGKGINFYLAQGHHLLDSKPELALKYFAKAGEVDPHSPEPDSGRGLAYSNMERWGDAVAAFQLSLKKSPEYTEAIMGLAEAYRAQGSAGNRRKALGLYRRYLDLAPDGPDAPVAKAQVEILEGDLKAETTPSNAAPPAPPSAPGEGAQPEVASPPTTAAPPQAAPPASDEPLNPPPPVLATPPKPPGP
jgi:predicted Zn finger-like uncharacterized protein